MSSYTVRELDYDDISEATAARMQELLNQLSTKPRTLCVERLRSVFHSDSYIIIAEDDSTGNILGMVSLIIPHQLIGKRAWGEDLVVDVKHRRNGIARKLMEYMLDLAEEQGVERIQATSSRPASQELCRLLGFTERNTKVFSIDLRTDIEEVK